jgi:hypothetical protein
MIIDTKPLKIALKAGTEWLEEQVILDAKYAECQDEIRAAVQKGKISDEKVQRRVGEARRTLDMVEARLPVVAQGVKSTTSGLRSAIKNLAGKWNAAITAEREAQLSKLDAALGEFGIDRRRAGIVNIPLISEINGKAAHLGDLPDTDLIVQAEALLRRINRHAASVNVEILES